MLTDFSVFVYHDLDRYFSGKRKLQNTEDSDESIDEEGNQFLDSCEVDSDVSECSEKQKPLIRGGGNRSGWVVWGGGER